MQDFKLIPFPTDTIPVIEIAGEITRANNNLFLRYEVKGDIAQILLPAKASSPGRTNNLWKATCFEFFLALPNESRYWEFNLSPSGDWNVYKMDGYRRVAFQEELVFHKMPFAFRKANGKLSLDITLDLNPLIQIQQMAQVGITTIIQTLDYKESHWALAHTSSNVDFHLKESFTLYI